LAAFIRHTSCPKCNSKDNLAVYADGSYFCFSYCGYKSVSEDFKEANKKSIIKVRSSIKKEIENMEVKPSSKPAMTPEENAEIKSETSVKAKGFRGISDGTYSKFGVRHAFAEDTGKVIEQYYPCTQDGQLVGYKVREVPKNFYSRGRTGADCELFMQFRFNRGGKYVVITEGEVDALSAYDMLSDYNKSKGWDFETAVVSPTTGAGSYKQIAGQYKFFDSFDNIIIAYDNDKAGQKATDRLLKVLPKGKVKIMPMRFKDANEYLDQNASSSFVSDFYSAKKQVPVGVLASSKLYERIMGQSAVSKIPFPPFMQKLNELFVGGMPLGHIVNIAADTGVGKTTLVNELIYYWIFNSPHTVGIVSMELDAGQYGEVLLSRHLERKIALIESQEEKIAYLSSPHVVEKARELTIKEDGDSRFYLLDNRDGTIEEIQDTVEELVSACGAKVIVLDPLQDILDGLSNEEQADFMKWAKGFIKSHGITFIFINHMRKTPAGQNGADSEQNIMGSSTIIKSSSANILLKRDKMSESEILRNSTDIIVTKNRICGLTGSAGSIYYDNATHTLHSLEEWLSSH
jgi:KaiC/GvpD/RAD55 family RecA-like ATPase/Zn ribbon nucleic-acid-binding protein